MAVFGLKYYAEDALQIPGPIKITWEHRGDDFDTPVKASPESGFQGRCVVS